MNQVLYSHSRLVLLAALLLPPSFAIAEGLQSPVISVPLQGDLMKGATGISRIQVRRNGAATFTASTLTPFMRQKPTSRDSRASQGIRPVRGLVSSSKRPRRIIWGIPHLSPSFRPGRPKGSSSPLMQNWLFTGRTRFDFWGGARFSILLLSHSQKAPRFTVQGPLAACRSIAPRAREMPKEPSARWCLVSTATGAARI